MLGLMGTLIPLGPGLLALSAGNTAELSEALVVAFGTTVIGLAAAALAMIVSKVRSLWYEQYIAMLDAAETGVLSRIDYENEESQALIAADAAARLNASAAPSQAGSKAKTSATVGGLEPAHE
jgi:negative regulator of sigma E activity